MDGRFTRQELEDVLDVVCARLGLDSRGATLLKFTNNAVYSLARAPVVVRIVGSRALRYRARKAVAVAEHFARHDVPAVRLLEGARQPFVVGEYRATVWHRVPARGRRATATELATLLRRVHALPAPEEVGPWTPLADVRARIADAEELAEDDRRFLLDRCTEVEQDLARLDFPLPRALLHGDAHAGNVIVSRDGPVLCDFDSCCHGPPEWDLTPLAVGRERFADPASWYRDLADGYGFDVTEWEDYPTLRAVRELKLTTSALPIVRSHPAVRHELHRRLSDLREGRMHTRWQRYR